MRILIFLLLSVSQAHAQLAGDGLALVREAALSPRALSIGASNRVARAFVSLDLETQIEYVNLFWELKIDDRVRARVMASLLRNIDANPQLPWNKLFNLSLGPSGEGREGHLGMEALSVLRQYVMTSENPTAAAFRARHLNTERTHRWARFLMHRRCESAAAPN